MSPLFKLRDIVFTRIQPENVIYKGSISKIFQVESVEADTNEIKHEVLYTLTVPDPRNNSTTTKTVLECNVYRTWEETLNKEDE